MVVVKFTSDEALDLYELLQRAVTRVHAVGTVARAVGTSGVSQAAAEAAVREEQFCRELARSLEHKATVLFERSKGRGMGHIPRPLPHDVQDDLNVLADVLPSMVRNGEPGAQSVRAWQERLRKHARRDTR